MINSIEEVVYKIKNIVDQTKLKIERLNLINEQFLEKYQEDIKENTLDKQLYIDANNQNIRKFKYEQKLQVFQESLEILNGFKKPKLSEIAFNN
ncbi:hypothetical protein OXYTRIMIC_248 [Oxytricha trifallax]|uniref:Uncharacterized protein n=1 Tax=Oxytricha trifallax TaxID=1172189 RepID=A0A073I0M3_9SPIT|nr:hypothetical protein OXYTRIMIC_248 [Oxytricha trifallax]